MHVHIAKPLKNLTLNCLSVIHSTVGITTFQFDLPQTSQGQRNYCIHNSGVCLISYSDSVSLESSVSALQMSYLL